MCFLLELYDSNVTPGTRRVPLKRVCRILRLLGQAPSEKDIKDICDTYSSEGLSQKGASLPVVFDPLDIGVIDATKLRETLLTVGECFTEKEAREFIKQANPTIE
ncbi:hypothetical protein X801_08941, partial [Opisthorchis viverrini]